MPTSLDGAHRPEPAAPPGAEPRLQRHQVHADRQGAGRRPRGAATRSSSRCSIPASASRLEVPHRVQGVRPARRRRKDRLRPRARPVDRRPHLARPQPSRRAAIDARQGHGFPGAACRSTISAGAGGSPRPHRRRTASATAQRTAACSASTTNRRSSKACASCFRAGAARWRQRQSLAAIAALAIGVGRPPDVIIADYHLGDGNGIAAILDLQASTSGPISRHC